MYRIINKTQKRLDGYEKVTGRAKYCDDMDVAGQLYAKTVYSRFPHAKIRSINTKDAEQVEGVVCIITAKDVPVSNEMFGRYPVLAEEEVKYMGDGVAVVAAESQRAAEEAAANVEVEYEELPGVYTIEEALEKNAPRVHQDREENLVEHTTHFLRAGDTEKGFQEAEVILEREYRTQCIDQAYIEPESLIAFPGPYRMGIEIHGSIQNPYTVRQNVAGVLGCKMAQVKVIQSTIGGSFGGKDESTMLMGARLAILALKTGRPVKMTLSREESFLESCKRHPYKAWYKIGAKKDGTIIAIQNRIYNRGGAYNNKGMFANWRGSIHAGGAYHIPHVKNDIATVYTNTMYSGAMRGFSAPQLVFCTESLIDELAAELNISPREIRLKNCLKPYDTMATGQVLDPKDIPAPLEQMITEVTEKTDFEGKRAHYAKENKTEGPIKKGIGMSITFRGAGLGGEGIDTAGATVTIDKDGSINIYSDMVEMGQGMRTAHAQIVAEALGVTLDRITFSNTDTSVVIDGGPTVASRGTLAGGNAMKIAADKLKKRLVDQAATFLDGKAEDLDLIDDTIIHKTNSKLSMDFDDLITRCGIERGISLSAQGWYNPGPEELSHETGQGNAYPTYVYGVCVAEVDVDTETGFVTVQKITSAHDVGTAINPQIVRGQLIGGLLMGLGYGLFEEVEQNKGFLQTHNFDSFLMPSVMDMPELDVILYETDDTVGPYGAKSVGELGIEMVSPALANAVFHATGRRIRELPMNLERVVLGKALRKGQ